MFDIPKLDLLTQQFLDNIKAKSIGDIDFDYAKNIYEDLIEVINYNNYLYYIENFPKISDQQYDMLFDYIKNIEVKFPQIISIDSPTQKLNFQVQDDFIKASHKVALLSLENSYNAQDLRDWYDFLVRQLAKVGDISFGLVVEPKYDGSSIELVYKYGKFVQGITRGDGTIGEDITQNLKVIPSIPMNVDKLKSIAEFRVRAEIVMSKKSLDRINTDRLKNGEMIFANTRNATAGSIRQLDPKITAKRGLVCYVYDFLYGDDINFHNQKGFLEFALGAGFNVYDYHRRFDNIDDLVALCEDKSTQDFFANQNIEFDGLVIKVDEFDIRGILGSTGHHPRWAMAYKFPAEQYITKIKFIELSLGRTGAIGPVANLESIKIGGVSVSRASLHNFDVIQSKDIMIGDYVYIQRSGEVIPYIIGVVKDKRSDCQITDYKYIFKDGEIAYDIPGHGVITDVSTISDKCNIKILPPTICPKCGGDVFRLPGEVAYYCSDISCQGIIKEQLKHFISKECMDIDGMGEKIIDLLVDSSIVRDFVDIYNLGSHRFNLKTLPLMGDKRVADLLAQIDISKTRHLWRIINGLGIKYVGKKSSKLLQDAIYQDWSSKGKNITDFGYQDLIKYFADTEFIKNIYGLGDKTVQSLSKFVDNKHNIEILKGLHEAGVRLNIFDIPQDNVKLLSDIRFSITGKFTLSRPKIAQILQDNGGTFDETPTKSTDFMVVGDEPGSKLAKAREYGVEIIFGIENLLIKYPSLDKYFQSSKDSPKIQPKSLFE